MRGSGKRRAWALGLLLACSSPDVIRVELVAVDGLDVERDFVTLSLQVRDELGAVVVDRRDRDISSLGNDLASAGALREGERYHLRTVGRTREGVCTRRGRAVGRSLPFTHRSGGYVISMQMGCADEFAPTRGQPIRGRLVHTMTSTRDGGAIVAGGWRGFTQVTLEALDPVRVIERYDATTGRFSEIGNLASLRLFAPTVELGDGRVAVVGGLNGALGVCLTNAEVIWPPGAAPVSRMLEAPRCGSRAVRLGETLAFVGGTPPPPALSPPFPRVEIHDASMVGEPTRVTGGLSRNAPRVTALAGNRGAFLGGGQELGVDFEVFLEDCGDGACLVPVPTEPAVGTGWAEMSTTYVTCAEGGGAVYAVGGVRRELVGEMTEEEETGEVWCWLDRPEGGVLRQIESLPEDAGYPRTIAVGGSSNPRLLVIANTVAQEVPVDPCTCGIRPAETERVPLPPGPIALLHEIATLADGTTLVHGGVTTFLDETRPIEGEPSAWLFVPDVPLDEDLE
ncbi:MAG: hypothetical protein AAGE52_23385 [Myxococcota bacterium]